MSIISNLLTTYSLIDVILILFLVAFAVKEIIQLQDFFSNRRKAKITEEQNDNKTIEKILEKLDELEDQVAVLYEDTTTSFAEIQGTLKEHEEKLDDLTDSDKDDIRADIVEKYHFFTKQGYIDDFSMDSVEKRYCHYKKEGGNSYITDLMSELRKLPKR